MMQSVSPVQHQMPSRRDEVTIVEPVRATKASDTSAEGNANAGQRSDEAIAKAEQEQRRLKEERLSQDTLDEIAKDLETLHAVGLNFTRHDETGRTMVRITNRDTDEVIREIPAKQVLDLAAKIEEMVGIIFDEKV